MTHRVTLPITLILTLLLGFAVGARAEENLLKFKLKPGAYGKLCLGCHTDMEETVKKPFVHTPLKSGACTGCHSPHTSTHGKLLAAPTTNICRVCHSTIVPEKAKSVYAGPGNFGTWVLIHP